ncbi:MAG: hypothetical protein CME62_17760 [Halobacteriovoraceae bacterium]|nr:hypothetical protein [Halobacteriovoraceae bacterium]|tara:strand:- start:122 stop:370 length:249 start_codon:yes stop_codon:yes gene_type:complete
MKNKDLYWKYNLRYILILLFFWAFVSFGLSILMVDWLNQFRLGDFKLGFWFAQQGSIFSFVIIIITYIFLMKRLDKKFGGVQ